MSRIRSDWHAVALALTLLLLLPARSVATEASISRDAEAALTRLYEQVPAAGKLAERAKAVLVFPSVMKGGLIVGAQYGEGALRKGGKTVGYYSTTGVSYGLQAGAQSFTYALFFMNEAALKYLDQSDGWEIGVGPSVVVVDKGMAETVTTTTTQQDIYAFIFSQKGLMAGLGLQGSKITRIQPDR